MKILSFIPRHIKWLIGLSIIAVIAIIATILVNNSKPTCSNCNVILVSLDTLSALHLPCYGYERDTAPNLCSYAKKNLLFTNSFSQAPATLDSHFSIFTSLYPHTHKMRRISSTPLDEKYLTLAQVMRNNGYDTIYHGTLTDLHLPLNRGIERGFNTVHGSSQVETWSESYKLLEENSKKNKKTFLFLHTYAVHDPYLTGHKTKHLYTNQKEYTNIPLTVDEFAKITPEYLEFVGNQIDLLIKDKLHPYKPYLETDVKKTIEMKNIKKFNEKLKIYNSLSIPYISYCLIAWAHKLVNENDPVQVEYLKALYDERIHQLDEYIEKLIQLVESPKYANNTILIVTADHGEEFKEHGYLYHGYNLFTTSTRVPLIIHIPGAKAKTIKEYVQGIDIYPTILSLLGLKPQSKIEGIDLTGIIKGEPNAATNKYLLGEFGGNLGIQQKNWRFYYSIPSKTSLKLYDLDADPKEKRNLIKDNETKRGEFLDIVKKLNISFN